jgi:energy-coupling factor transport system substrate-specific component
MSKVTVSGEKTGKGLSVSDLVTVGIFAALYFLVTAVVTFTFGALIPVVGSLLLPAGVALLAGSIYYLLIAKVPRFGGLTAIGAVMGAFFFFSGHFALSFAACLVFGVAGDLIARVGAYVDRKLNLLGYVIFSFGITGPILPLWLMRDQYVAALVARGKDSAYIDKVFAGVNSTMAVVVVVAVLVCAVVGGVFGRSLVERHFKKANLA